MATTIDFNALTNDPEINNGGLVERGNLYGEDGYLLENLQPVLSFLSVHEGNFRYFGSPALINNGFGDTQLTRQDGGTFSLNAISLNSLNGIMDPECFCEPFGDYTTARVTVTFRGLTSDGITVHQSFTTDTKPGFERFAFGADFYSLISVTWRQDSPYHYFDDIEVTAVPESSTYALIIAGLAMVVFTQRTRRKR